MTAADRIREIDKLSLRDRIDQLGLSPDDEALIAGLVGAEAGGSTSRGALTMMGHWWALAGLNDVGFAELGTYRLAGGTRRLLEAMLADANVEPRLGSPVAALSDDGELVEVTTRDGERITTRGAIVTVPVNVWRTIRFSPDLPEAHSLAATDTIGVPTLTALTVHVRGDIGGPFYAQGDEDAAPGPARWTETNRRSKSNSTAGTNTSSASRTPMWPLPTA